MTDTEPVSWRIYHHEWLTVNLAYPHNGHTAQERATAFFDEHYAGRIRPEDVRYIAYPQCDAVQLQLRLPNLRGEFKDRAAAQRFLDSVAASEIHLVGADTDDDLELRNYGVKALPV